MDSEWISSLGKPARGFRPGIGRVLDKPLSDGCGRASLQYALPVHTVRSRQHAIGRKDRLERVTVRGCPYYPWMWLALIETALAFGELACNQTITVPEIRAG